MSLSHTPFEFSGRLTCRQMFDDGTEQSVGCDISVGREYLRLNDVTRRVGTRIVLNCSFLLLFSDVRSDV